MDRREFLRTASIGSVIMRMGSSPTRMIADPISIPRPSAAQLAWQRDELAMFIHFGMNTFTDREWGEGTESPLIFNPAALDARQWARTARAAGFRTMILTAKHHDGFCLWPTRTTAHSVAASPFRSGQGDVVREFVEACRAEGLKPGLYLSPWDRHEPRYGDSPAYNDFYIAQLTELLTHYGAIHEVWFDGANGEGPNGRRQQYNWPRTWSTVRQLQPQAVMFSDAGPDLRWIGNERGAAGETNWSTVRPEIVTVPGMSGNDVTRSLQDGDRDGTVWRPGETDVSIRPGWFHHPAEDAKVRTPADLVSLYESSVGRNSKLLLNVPPTRDGRLHDADIASLMGLRSALDAQFAHDLAAGAHRRFHVADATHATLDISLPNAASVGMIDLREDVGRGQRVAAYAVQSHDGTAWQELARGTTIGCRRLMRVQPTRCRRLRLVITDSVATPVSVSMRCYASV